MIEISHVNKSFGSFRALEDVSITIKKGSVYGIVGENGAGKSTILQCLVGIYDVEEGSVLIEGQSIYENNLVKSSIGYVADRNQYFKEYTVRQMADLYKLIYPSFSEEKFYSYNEVFKLNPRSKVKNLSKGMQMRLAIMLNMAFSPKLLVLDEPTAGLDVIAKKQIIDLIIEEVAQSEMTVVISSHHLIELEKICDEVTIIHQGKVMYQTSVDELKASVKKLQVVFEKEAPKGFSEWDEILKIEKIGSVFYIITDKYSQMFEEKLRNHSAMLIEPIGLDLEEVFIYTQQNIKRVNR